MSLGMGRFLMKAVARPRVIHRDTGHADVLLAALRHVPEKYHGLAAHLPALCGLLDGVKHAELQFETGTIQVDYDPERLSEKGLLTFLEQLTAFVLHHRKTLARIGEDDEALTSLKAELHGKMAEWDIA